MLIDDNLRKTMTFLYVDATDEETGQIKRKPCGTAFFVSYPLDSSSHTVYAVSARHVITRSLSDGPLFLRINNLDGSYEDIEANQDKWIEHHATDIAIQSVSLPDNADIKAIPLSYLVTDEYVEEKGVGIGDDVFFIGLFTGHPGQQRVRPVVRFGNISMMPQEKVRIETEPGTAPIEVEAYLIEARSLGGHSGSPTFIHFPIYRKPGVATLPKWPLQEPLFKLLGLVSSHHNIPSDAEITGDVLGKITVYQNAGIAVVIPAKYIAEVLEFEELAEERENLK